jgi:beta-glucosidase
VRAVAAANPRTVVVVNSGGPVEMPWRDEVGAVLLAWFGGQELGRALADVLLGEREPGGRLPTTWPAREADVPVLLTQPSRGVLEYAEGLHVGYRAWARAAVAPAYPFGHGLGYTTWDYDGADVAGGAVRVRLRNTGARAGREVVQAYLSRPGSAVERPALWLAGYAAVEAGPGEAAEAVIALDERAFRHWAGARWQVEPGAYTVRVGRSAGDLRLDAQVTPGG